MFEVENGIRISGTSFWLDATRKVPFSFVSHAHSDHVRRHNKIIATPPTISLIKNRNRNINAIPLSFGEKFELEDISIELFPAGHILGSAQILIQRDDLRLIYSGDFKTEKNDTAEQCLIKQADILIMESTFGAPQFVFPKKWLIIEKLVKYIDNCFSKGFIPVLLGYGTGKAQEALKLLGDLDYQISVHASIEPAIKVYEKFGIQFKNYQTYFGEDMRNRVLIIPPHFSRGNLIKKLANAKKIVLTGWAKQPNAKYRYGADEALPFSDHADYNQLIEYVRKVNPQKVYITHGQDHFIHDLKREGFDAELLHPKPQLSLF